jgi:hypothetical protein
MKASMRLILISTLCLLSGLVIGYNAHLKQTDEEIYRLQKQSSVMNAAEDLRHLGKLKAEITNGDKQVLDKHLSEWISESQGVLKQYEKQMTEKEKYYAKWAAYTLETGKYPNEITSPWENKER